MSEVYPLTLTAILYLAARQDSSEESDSGRLSMFGIEAMRLTADTLFENPCSIDNVHVMLLPAIHSEKPWFAIDHAHQMALDLGLHESMIRVISEPRSCTRDDFRCARLELLVVYFDRVDALGSPREPRCKAMSPAAMETFVEHRYSHLSEV